MTQCLLQLRHFCQLVSTLLMLLTDTTRFLQLCLRPPAALAAENLFLRKQLALYTYCISSSLNLSLFVDG